MWVRGIIKWFVKRHFQVGSGWGSIYFSRVRRRDDRFIGSNLKKGSSELQTELRVKEGKKKGEILGAEKQIQRRDFSSLKKGWTWKRILDRRVGIRIWFCEYQTGR